MTRDIVVDLYIEGGRSPISLSYQHEASQELIFILQYFCKAEAYFGRDGEASGINVCFVSRSYKGKCLK